MLAPTGHTAIDQFRVTGQADFRPKTKTFHHAWTEAFKDRVRILAQIQHQLYTPWCFEIYTDHGPASIHDVKTGMRCKNGFMINRALYTNHTCTHVRQQHSGKLTGADAGNFYDFKTFQWTHGCTDIPVKIGPDSQSAFNFK